ncbi:hypothetical protein IFM89_028613 [Coptis chinensis]|uniref:Uncharacterized protein n=1 Tax=Coptis chinensis TaxID=261450 RepID=A0A835M4J3_9MAGN|nr:hypothetical protein IFM89_028613 [Coptis chinensis]
MGNTIQKTKQTGDNNLEEQQQEDGDVSSFFTCAICIEPVSCDKRFKNIKICAHNSYCLGYCSASILNECGGNLQRSKGCERYKRHSIGSAAGEKEMEEMSSLQTRDGVEFWLPACKMQVETREAVGS